MNERNKGIDLLKFLASFMIVCIHAPIPGEWGGYWDAICKIAVPCFFMITGYFYDISTGRMYQTRQIRKIFFLVIWSNVLYWGWGMIWSLREGTVIQYLSNFISLSSVWNKKISTGALISGHLWYVLALLLVLVIILIFDKLERRKYLYWSIPILYLSGVFLGKYSFVFFDESISIVYSRNFLFTGLCFFLIGNLIYKMENHDNYKTIVHKYKCLILPIALLLVSAEKFILQCMSQDGKGDMYLTTAILAIAVFVFFSGHAVSAKIFMTMSNLGKNHSTYIYIFHYMILDFFKRVVARLGAANSSVAVPYQL